MYRMLKYYTLNKFTDIAGYNLYNTPVYLITVLLYPGTGTFTITQFTSCLAI